MAGIGRLLFSVGNNSNRKKHEGPWAQESKQKGPAPFPLHL